ncbi:hypothetical protein TIFTF001_050275 [Ficus carica]|uniref:Uncharacterized protein n=1 Tax=Ficus carica TaxID=3494 RepID=A0AA87YUK6_FICCA|nr:hypothetical protein TIFTF001_050275 [Ficus carica]
MHSANLCVYVNKLRNEYVTLAFIYFSDPIVEITATYVQVAEVDGLTLFSAKSLTQPEIQPPAQAPAAPLQVKDAVDPPFPPVGRPKSIWPPIHLLRQLSQTVERERDRGLAATMAATDRQPPHGERQKLHFPAEESKANQTKPDKPTRQQKSFLFSPKSRRLIFSVTNIITAS